MKILPPRRSAFVTTITATAVAALALVAIGDAAAQKRIYIAADDHTDYFWGESPAFYRDAFARTLDHYIARAEADIAAARPAAQQSRWNADGSLWLWEYQRQRSPQDFQRLIALIASGHISVPLNPLVGVDGATPLEAVLRGMYYPGRIERQYGVDFDLAVAMENQTHALGLASLWAGAGAKYSWKGVCHCGSIVPDSGDREREIYWYRGLDGRQILMKWYSLLDRAPFAAQFPGLSDPNQGPGGYAEARDPAAAVRYVDGDSGFRRRYPFDVIGLFGYGWDDLQTQIAADAPGDLVRVARELSTPQRQVIVSNESDFFEDFADRYGAELETQTVSYGNDWELYLATLAEVSAGLKRGVEKLRSAEALAALVGLRRPGFMNGREQARERAWMNLGLYFEHNFGMEYIDAGAPAVAARIAWQRRLVAEIDDYVDTLYDDAAAALGELIAKPGGARRFYVFNPLGWARDDVADLRYDGDAVRVVEVDSGAAVPSQRIVRDGRQYLRIAARGVPAVGYRVYELRAGDDAFAAAVETGPNTLDNGVYRLTLNRRGAITSLIERASGREFVRRTGDRWLNDIGAGDGGVRVVDAGPVSASLLAEIGGGGLTRTTRVTLYRDGDRVDIDNRILENFGDTHHWAFGFALDGPDVWHEEVGAVINAKTASRGGHYSDRVQNTRYDWLTLNHFADVRGADGAGVTLSNADLYFMRLGNSSAGSLDTQTAQLSVLAGGEVVGSGSNSILDQGGDDHFTQRFALRTYRDRDLAASMRFALEHQNPLLAADVTATSPAYPAAAFALLNVSNPQVLLWALKPADDGGGLTARLWNLSNGANSARLGAPGATLRAARSLSHIETPLGPLSLSDGELAVTFGAQQLATFGLDIDLDSAGDRGGLFYDGFEASALRPVAGAPGR